MRVIGRLNWLWFAAALAASSTPSALPAQGTLPEWGRPLTPAQGRILREQVGKLSRQLGVREKTLIAVARVVGADSRTPDFPDLMRRVRAQAGEAAKLRSEIGELRRRIAEVADPAVRHPAEQALARATTAFENGRLDEAAREFANLEGLRRSDLSAARSAWLQAVEARARVAELQLNYDDAVAWRLTAADEERKASAAQQWALILAAADSRRAQGIQNRSPAILADALAIAVDRALPLAPRSERPLDWAATQQVIGFVLWGIGMLEPGTTAFEKAETAFRGALEEYRPDRDPLKWGYATAGLADVLTAHGEREGGSARIAQAVDGYHAALAEVTRERAPAQWAQVQVNLGNALKDLGLREADPARLREAVAIYRAALEVLTRDEAPFEWAGIQTNIGSTLAAIGGHEQGTESWREAAAALRGALEVRKREQGVVPWALTTITLADVLTRIWYRTREPSWLDEAERRARDARKALAAEPADAGGLAYADRVLQRIASLRAGEMP